MKDKQLYGVGLMVISLLAFWLRLHGLFANSFHADEALFANWARYIVSWRDPLLLTQAVDKPPLLFYLQALFYLPAGAVEWAARLPNFMASVWLVPLTAVLYRHLFPDPVDKENLLQRHRDAEKKRVYHAPSRTSRIKSPGMWGALLASLIMACSPLAIQFSPTAFTDPLLAFWLTASCCAIGIPYSVFRKPITDYRLPITSGLLFGLAIATKYQAWLFLPLVGGLGWLMGYGRAQWSRWLMGLLLVLTAVLLWEYARTGSFSLWSAQLSNYGGVRLAWSWEVGPRALAWARVWRSAVPLPLLFFLVLVLPGMVWHAWRVDDSASRVELLLSLFVVGYVLLHWFTAVPVWDRYLLPLLPIVAILIGRGVVAIWGYWDIMILNYPISQYPNIRLALFSAFFVIAMLFLLFPAWAARNGRYPVGGQANADQGAAQIAAVLADAPYGTVLYDHWYSWQWGYHLFWGTVYVSWFPHGAALADDLAVFGRDGQPRYVALPNEAVSQPIIRTIHDAGFQLQHIAQAGNITLYQILPDDSVIR